MTTNKSKSPDNRDTIGYKVKSVSCTGSQEIDAVLIATDIPWTANLPSDISRLKLFAYRTCGPSGKWSFFTNVYIGNKPIDEQAIREQIRKRKEGGGIFHLAILTAKGVRTEYKKLANIKRDQQGSESTESNTGKMPLLTLLHMDKIEGDDALIEFHGRYQSHLSDNDFSALRDALIELGIEVVNDTINCSCAEEEKPDEVSDSHPCSKLLRSCAEDNAEHEWCVLRQFLNGNSGNSALDAFPIWLKIFKIQLEGKGPLDPRDAEETNSLIESFARKIEVIPLDAMRSANTSEDILIELWKIRYKLSIDNDKLLIEVSRLLTERYCDYCDDCEKNWETSKLFYFLYKENGFQKERAFLFARMIDRLSSSLLSEFVERIPDSILMNVCDSKKPGDRANSQLVDYCIDKLYNIVSAATSVNNKYTNGVMILNPLRRLIENKISDRNRQAVLAMRYQNIIYELVHDALSSADNGMYETGGGQEFVDKHALNIIKDCDMNCLERGGATIILNPSLSIVLSLMKRKKWNRMECVLANWMFELLSKIDDDRNACMSLSVILQELRAVEANSAMDALWKKLSRQL